jgi:hypothetical protein
MAEETAHELAELLSHVLGVLPRDASGDVRDDGGSQLVTIRRRDGDRFLARWAIQAPNAGEHVRLQLVTDSAVYGILATIAGIHDGESRYLTVSEVCRKSQRREAERAQLDDLVLISHDGDIDAKLVDVSGDGIGFELDRPLPVDAIFKAVINFHGSVISTTAQVRNARRLDDHRYRIGCGFVEIPQHHRATLHRYAAQHPVDRRSERGRDAQRLGFLRKLRDAA